MPANTRRKQVKGAQSPKGEGEVADTNEENKIAAEVPQKDGGSGDVDDSINESEMMADDVKEDPSMSENQMGDDATENPCLSEQEDSPMMADDANSDHEDPKNQIKSDNRTAASDETRDASADVTEQAGDEDDSIMEDAVDADVGEELVGEGDLEGDDLDLDLVDVELDDENIEYDVMESSEQVDAESEKPPKKKRKIETALRWLVLVAPVTLQDFTQTQADNLMKLSEVMGYRTVRMPPLHLRKHPNVATLSLNTNGLLYLRVSNDNLVRMMKSILTMAFHHSKITVSMKGILPSDKLELDLMDKPQEHEFKEFSNNLRPQAKFAISNLKKAKEMVTSQVRDSKGDKKHRCVYLKEVPDNVPIELLSAIFPMALSADRVKIKAGTDHSSVVLEMASSEQADSVLYIYEGLNFDDETPVHVATSTKSIWNLQKAAAREMAESNTKKKLAQGKARKRSHGRPMKKQAMQTSTPKQQPDATRTKRPGSQPSASMKTLQQSGALKVVRQQAAKLAEMERKVALLKRQAQLNQLTIIQQQTRRYPSDFSGEGMYPSRNNRPTQNFQQPQKSGGMHAVQQQSGGMRAVQQKSGGMRAVQQKSGGMRAVQQKSGGMRAVQQKSGGMRAQQRNQKKKGYGKKQ